MDTAQISAGAVTGAKIGTNEVKTANINGDAVTTNKLAANAVTNVKVADDAIDTDQIANSAVETAQIAANAVTHGKVHSDVIDANPGGAGLTALEHGHDTWHGLRGRSRRHAAGTFSVQDDGGTTVTNIQNNDHFVIADNSNSNENRRISWSSLHGEIDFPLVDIIDDGYTALPTNATISGPIEFLMGYPSNLEATTPTYRMAFSRLETWLENVLDLGTNQINDDAITNAKIANGAVDTDQLATDAVTTAKMASGTAQRVIVYNAGGNPVVGQVDTNGISCGCCDFCETCGRRASVLRKSMI